GTGTLRASATGVCSLERSRSARSGALLWPSAAGSGTLEGPSSARTRPLLRASSARGAPLKWAGTTLVAATLERPGITARICTLQRIVALLLLPLILLLVLLALLLIAV